MSRNSRVRGRVRRRGTSWTSITLISAVLGLLSFGLAIGGLLITSPPNGGEPRVVQEARLRHEAQLRHEAALRREIVRQRLLSRSNLGNRAERLSREQERRVLVGEIERLRHAYARAREQAAQLRRASRDTLPVASLARSVERQRRVVGKLQTVILNDPQKALGIVLLNHDLHSQQAETRTSIASIQSDVERQYDMMKWIIGSVLLTILGMVLGAVLPVLRGRGDATAGVAGAD